VVKLVGVALDAGLVWGLGLWRHPPAAGSAAAAR